MLKQIQRFIQKCNDDQIATYSGYAAFFTILSVLPFLMLLLALMKYTPITEETLIQTVTGIVPAAFHEILRLIITDLSKLDRVTTLVSITALTALWSASKGIAGLMSGLNAVCHVKNYSMIRQRLTASLYTIGFIFLIILTLILIVFGNQIHLFLSDHFPLVARFSGLLISIRSYLLIVIMTLYFMLIYEFLPNRKARYLAQFPGAAISAVGWTMLSLGFSLYIDYFSSRSMMYGSLTTILLLLLWLYLCMYLLLLGAEFNSFLEPYLHHKRSTTSP